VGLGKSPKLEDTLWEALTDSYTGCRWPDRRDLATKYGISQKEVDGTACRARSFRRGPGGWAPDGRDCPLDLPGKRARGQLRPDEHNRPETTLESLAKLPKVFKKDGVIHAARPVASATARAPGPRYPSVRRAERAEASRQARRLGIAVATRPSWASVRRPRSGRARASRGQARRLRSLEVNEAFAPQYLAVEKDLGLPRDRTNVDGGAIAVGHPLAASGARINGTPPVRDEAAGCAPQHRIRLHRRWARDRRCSSSRRRISQDAARRSCSTTGTRLRAWASWPGPKCSTRPCATGSRALRRSIRRSRPRSRFSTCWTSSAWPSSTSDFPARPAPARRGQCGSPRRSATRVWDPAERRLPHGVRTSRPRPSSSRRPGCRSRSTPSSAAPPSAIRGGVGLSSSRKQSVEAISFAVATRVSRSLRDRGPDRSSPGICGGCSAAPSRPEPSGSASAIRWPCHARGRPGAGALRARGGRAWHRARLARPQRSRASPSPTPWRRGPRGTRLPGLRTESASGSATRRANQLLVNLKLMGSTRSTARGTCRSWSLRPAFREGHRVTSSRELSGAGAPCVPHRDRSTRRRHPPDHWLADRIYSGCRRRVSARSRRSRSAPERSLT